MLSAAVPGVTEAWRDAAARWPGRSAVSAPGHDPLTYAALWDRAGRVAAALGRAGVREGERVLVAATREPVGVAHLLGVLRLGATAVPVPADLAAGALGRRLDVAGSRWLLETDGSCREVVGAVDTGAVADPPAWLIFTSGSTATPRAVAAPTAAVRFAADAILRRLDYREDDVVLSLLPLTFDYGLYQALLCALTGAHLVLAEAGEVVRLPAVARRTAATVLPLVPSLAAGAVARPGGADGVRLLTTTGERVPPDLVARLGEVFPAADVRLMYGTTECKRISVQTAHAASALPGSSGPPLQGTRLRIEQVPGLADPDRGEIVVAGPHVMDGYWRDPEATAEVFRRRDGETWLHTRDIGWVDERGEVHVEGRMDDVLKIKGVRTSVTEIEGAAHRVPGVTEAALLVTPDREPVLFVAAAGQVVGEVHALLARELGHDGVPGRCVVLPELPHTAHGKVDRRTLLGSVVV